MLNQNEIFEHFNEMNRQAAADHVLAAIWFESPVNLPNGERRARITDGDEIAVQDGKIVNCFSGIATHKIQSCHGTLSSSHLYFKTIRLSDNQPEIITIK